MEPQRALAGQRRRCERVSKSFNLVIGHKPHIATWVVVTWVVRLLEAASALRRKLQNSAVFDERQIICAFAKVVFFAS